MTVHCPHCETPLAPDMTAGEGTICPACGSAFRGGDTTTGWQETRPILGKFELIEEVGAGAFGSVYRARDRELGRTVAVKVPRTGSLGSSGDSDRFLREARSVAQLRHPAIVPVFEIGQDGGTPYLVSEFVQGITLADRLTGERLAPRAVADLVASIADALDYAHRQGVVHRDVKPSNIMLETGVMSQESRAGKSVAGSSLSADACRLTPRLMDFGLAKRDAGEVTMTVEGQVLGTPAYMSPEQARGESHRVDGRSDVYSLGVILYQLLTGVLPFQGNARMLLHHVLHDDPKPPRGRDPNVPRDLETVCLKAMAKETAHRYQTAGELAADLRRFLAGEPILARPISLREKLWRRVRQNPTVYSLGTAVVVLTGVIIGVVASRPREAPSQSGPSAVAETTQPETSADDLLKVVAELDRTDPGWRFEQIEAKRKVIPDDQNGALQVLTFRKLVAELLGRSHSEGGWMHPDISGRLSALLELPPTVPINEADLRKLQAELKRVEPCLLQARKMIAYPEGRFAMTYTRDFVTVLLSDQQAARHMVNLLEVDARINLQLGNRPVAVNSCRAMLNCCGVYNGEPLAISQVIRFVVIRSSLRVLERLEAQGSCSDAELRIFQRQLEEEANYPMHIIMARGERAVLHYFLGALHTGDASPDALEMFGYKTPSDLPSGRDLRRFHVWMLRHYTKWVEIARLAPEQWSPRVAMLEDEEQKSPFIDYPIGQTVRKLASPEQSLGAVLQHLALTRSSLVALAVERYRLAHGEWPRDLAALLPTYLKEVPTDPFDGQPIRFRRTAEGVVIYCVGLDRTDNQGNIHRTGPLTDGLDVGFQLWDLAKRRQPKETGSP